MRGFCAGSLIRPPELPVRCPVCRWSGDLTPAGLIGPHVEEPGPATIWVDTGYEGKVDSWRAYNSPTPGLLVACPVDWMFDEWVILHTDTTGCLHNMQQVFDGPEKAREVCAELAKCANWLGDTEALCSDSELQLRVQAVIYLGWRAQFAKDPSDD